MSSIKKSQHYVWKHYLKPWTLNGKIYCSRNGEIFRTSPDNIAQQTYFYKSNPINAEEIKFSNIYINVLDPSVRNLLKYLLEFYHQTSDSDDYFMKCGIEDFHGIVEKKFIPLLSKLYLADLSFFKNKKEKDEFSFFIGCQYTRTNNMRSRLVNSELFVPENVNIENVAKIFSLFFAAIIGNWIFNKANIQFVINKTSELFITGDQPVFNLKADNSMEIDPTEFELFYPISPSQAIILSETKNKSSSEIRDIERIRWFNSKVRENANEQIYSKYENNLTNK